jgi:hypothetical protein
MEKRFGVDVVTADDEAAFLGAEIPFPMDERRRSLDRN